MSHPGVKPFLKWAGGKRQLLSKIRLFYPSSFGRYWEPFLGSGAVFFDLCASGRLAGHTATVFDRNPDLIACYETVRAEPEAVIAALESLSAEHEKRGNACYYEVRDARFNPMRAALAARNPRRFRYTSELAAMLIYLNRTGFNGLFRLNARGEFNVPAGRYAKPRICDAENLRRVAAALNAPGVTLARARFDRVLKEAREGDFLYVDPPYAPLSPTARFTSYTADGFGPDDQRALQQVVVELAGRGRQILLSNSTAPEIAALYQRNVAARRAGLRCYRVSARRAINATASRRGPVTEFLITNIRQSRNG